MSSDGERARTLTHTRAMRQISAPFVADIVQGSGADRMLACRLLRYALLGLGSSRPSCVAATGCCCATDLPASLVPRLLGTALGISIIVSDKPGWLVPVPCRDEPGLLRRVRKRHL
jgi:hypothetical protein